MPLASQDEGSRSVVMGPAVAGFSRRQRKPVAWLRPRHTRSWSVGAPTVVADCHRLRFVPLPCQMQRSATVNAGVWRPSR